MIDDFLRYVFVDVIADAVWPHGRKRGIGCFLIAVIFLIALYLVIAWPSKYKYLKIEDNDREFNVEMVMIGNIDVTEKCIPRLLRDAKIYFSLTGVTFEDRASIKAKVNGREYWNNADGFWYHGIRIIISGGNVKFSYE